MPRRITDEQELLDFINGRPSKKKKMTITIIVLALVAAFLIFIGVKMHEASVFSHNMEAAAEALEAKNYQEAVDLYNSVVEENGKNAELFEGRGDAYYGLGQYESAIKDYHTAIGLNKSNEELYKKGVKAGLKMGKNKQAMVFINDMKENIGEEKGEELRKETFVYPAEKALKKKLKALQKTAASTRDAWANRLQSHVFFDVDGDGVRELLTEFGNNKERDKKLTVYSYRKGKVKTMLDRSEYGVVSIKSYDKTGSMELLSRGNGMEEYRYYKLKSTGYSKKASSKRRSAAGGAYSDGQWFYYSSGDYDSISQSEYNKITRSMKKGKARSTNKSSWKSDQ